jgi:iron complex transport system ATP-binding protein
MKSVLKIDSLSVQRGTKTVLEDICLLASGGQVLGLIGPNGAGKSTLLKAIACALPYKGHISFNAEPVSMQMLGYLPQGHQINSALSVLEVMLLGLGKNLGWRISQNDIGLAIDTLELFDISQMAQRKMCMLSGGQQQMVLLAQRLMQKPKLMLLDEPTSALDLHFQISVFSILRNYAKAHNALIVAAIHDLTLASQNCDQIALLQAGKMQAFGATKQVINAQHIGQTYQVEFDLYHNQSGVELPIAVRVR